MAPPTAEAKRLPSLLCLVLLAATTVPALPQEDGLAAALNDAIRSARRTTGRLGVHVVRVADGEEVAAYRADDLHIVASNTKLFTTGAALDQLGPGYLFETEVFYRGPVNGGVLRGDLLVRGAGDPNLSGRHYFGDALAPFRPWAEALLRLGVRSVGGDLVLEHGFLDDELVHPDWPRNQLDRWYEAPVSALSFSDNSLLVRAWPNGGSRGSVEVLPDLGVLEVSNSTRTVSSARQHSVRIDRAVASPRVEVSGPLYRSAAPVEAWISVPDPLAYFGAALRRAFAEAGIVVEGEIVPTAELPDRAGWRRLAVHRSDLLTTIAVINKRSQNFYAESLLKTLGAERCGEGSWRAGLELIREFLADLGVAGDYKLADGSGMSRNNLFSARQLTTYLQGMVYHPLSREFLESLPYSGEIGLKWEERLAEPPYRGNVFAKTGGLRGVITLSGYAKGRSGALYAFSILCNETRGAGRAKAAQDEILRRLIEHG